MTVPGKFGLQFSKMEQLNLPEKEFKAGIDRLQELKVPSGARRTWAST